MNDNNSKSENKVQKFIKDYLYIFIMLAVTGVALYIRYRYRYYKSLDAREFLEPWFFEIKDNGGFAGLKQAVGNYNIPYQILIAIGTYLPFGYIVWYKMISTVFDILLALGVAGLLKTLNKDISKTVLAISYSVALLLPTVTLDTALWGQCDSIYVSFIIWAIVFLYKDKKVISFLLLGTAFAFKLQFIFILPFFALIILAGKKINLLYFLLVIVPDIVLCFPVIVFGRTFLETFDVYFGQADLYREMVINTCNFWRIFGDPDYDTFYYISLALCVVLIAAIMIVMLIKNKKSQGFIMKPDSFIKLALITSMTMIMFMPGMHERYTYLIDILLLAVAFVDKKYIPLFIVEEVISLFTYMYFLFGTGYPATIFSVINICIWLFVLVDLCFIKKIDTQL